ncbi:hypothetical protein DICPUDRAFT_75450 [Dictyostelium purpureum]|uniref:Ste24 endopeptidase n=1 Tax=Dictyostelium purpureum TaxID=5786 RepID=F0ZAP5_DICPU|nr:uncharacterized protein DICPUDRAFT_75450 [Dictyostelium purpureum]EGC39036.1 hypothetical protein DICPUDRAFT_75450 [Dictyostelium purpureum]|eukprot:XP_003284489.1 hypothetical protein DICPUDRAFT_75450 [Dictyostelium purpureum]
MGITKTISNLIKKYGSVTVVVYVWCIGIVLGMIMFNIQPLLEMLPWFQFTISCNMFIFFLELYLDIRQSFTIRAFNYPNFNYHEINYHIQNILGLINFSRIESTIGFIIECLVLYFGVLVNVYNLNDTIFYYFGFNRSYEITRGMTYLLEISLVSSLVRLPFEMYRIYLDQPPVKDDIDSASTTATPTTTTTPANPTPTSSTYNYKKKDWIKQIIWDQIKMFLISLLIGLPMLTITLSMFYWQYPYQWLTIVIFVSIVALCFSDLYPNIAYLFNKFTVLEEGELRNEIIELSRKLDFPLHEIYTMDGSKRVSHSNAFLMGFWTSSFVLYDNLVTKLSTEEILAIIGHEIGHHKYFHNMKHLLIQLVFVGNFIYLFSSVVNLQVFYRGFGFERVDVSVGLVLFSYLYSTFANLLRFVTNLIRREFEYAADAYAIKHGLEMKKALVSMHGKGVYIKPDRFFSLYYYSHPTLMERLESIDLIKKNLNQEEIIKETNNINNKKLD